uniref:Thioredoxin domain-containing protein n=1 Tax=Crocodylus porosus TaxID=8502 RepID=A0A7M4FAU0_CROPO
MMISKGPFHMARLLVLVLALARVPALLGAGLYSAADGLALLQADTLERSVLGSAGAWVVEFYASWCSDCVHFAPTWRTLAADVLAWRPAVAVGAVDCQNECKTKECGNFEVPGFPTLRVKSARPGHFGWRREGKTITKYLPFAKNCPNCIHRILGVEGTLRVI